MYVWISPLDSSPLFFIFEHTAYNGMDALMKKIITEQGEVLVNNSLPWSCLNISPDSCCKGNLVMCESCLSMHVSVSGTNV